MRHGNLHGTNGKLYETLEQFGVHSFYSKRTRGTSVNIGLWRFGLWRGISFPYQIPQSRFPPVPDIGAALSFFLPTLQSPFHSMSLHFNNYIPFRFFLRDSTQSILDLSHQSWISLCCLDLSPNHSSFFFIDQGPLVLVQKPEVFLPQSLHLKINKYHWSSKSHWYHISSLSIPHNLRFYCLFPASNIGQPRKFLILGKPLAVQWGHGCLIETLRGLVWGIAVKGNVKGWSICLTCQRMSEPIRRR